MIRGSGRGERVSKMLVIGSQRIETWADMVLLLGNGLSLEAGEEGGMGGEPSEGSGVR